MTFELDLKNEKLVKLELKVKGEWDNHKD